MILCDGVLGIVQPDIELIAKLKIQSFDQVTILMIATYTTGNPVLSKCRRRAQKNDDEQDLQLLHYTPP